MTAAVVMLFAAFFLVVSVAPVVADPVVKNSLVRQCWAAIKNTAAKPQGVRKIGPEAITPLGGKDSAAVAIAANAFFRYERIFRVTAVKSGVTLPVGVGMPTATAHIYPHSAA